MSARTPFVVAGAITLLGGAAVAFLVLMDGSGSKPAEAEPPLDPDAVAAAAAVRAASREGTPPEQPVAEGAQHVGSRPVPPPVPPPPTTTEAAPGPKPVGWESAPVLTAARREGETGAGGEVLARLEELKPRLSLCYDAEAETRPGATPPTTWGDGAQSEGDEPVFVLELESPDRGQYRIVDAPVKSRGGLEDGALSCVQSILRGAVVAAPSASPGERAVLHYSP